MTFRDLITTKKGEIGEKIVEQYLRDQGFETFRSSDLDNSHAADFMAVPHKRPGRVIICDSKAKPCRVNYPDTGIDLECWHHYKALGEASGMRVFLFFVDEDKGQVYGNWLDILDQRHERKWNGRRLAYPWTQNTVDREIRYFDMQRMRVLATLSQDAVAELRSLSSRDPQYQAIADLRAQQTSLFEEE